MTRLLIATAALVLVFVCLPHSASTQAIGGIGRFHGVTSEPGMPTTGRIGGALACSARGQLA
jgi:hypothetical protein